MSPAASFRATIRTQSLLIFALRSMCVPAASLELKNSQEPVLSPITNLAFAVLTANEETRSISLRVFHRTTPESRAATSVVHPVAGFNVLLSAYGQRLRRLLCLDSCATSAGRDHPFLNLCSERDQQPIDATEDCITNRCARFREFHGNVLLLQVPNEDMASAVLGYGSKPRV